MPKTQHNIIFHNVATGMVLQWSLVERTHKRHIRTKQIVIVCVILGPNPRVPLELFMSLKTQIGVNENDKIDSQTAAVGEMLLSHAPLGRRENN